MTAPSEQFGHNIRDYSAVMPECLRSVSGIQMTLSIFSGLMISKVVLSTFGLSGSQDIIWRGLHTLASSAALIIVGLHVALHWKWIVSTIKRYAWQPLLKARVSPSQGDAAQSRGAARNLGQAHQIPHYVRNDTTGRRPALADFANGQAAPTGELRGGDHESRGGSWETMGRNLLEIAAIVAVVQAVWSIGRWLKRIAAALTHA